MKPLYRITRRPRIAIFDWSNVVARAYTVDHDHGMSVLLKMLKSYRNRFPGWRFVFCTEGAGVARRRRIFATYKAQREHEGPTTRHPESIRLLSCLTGTVVRAPNGEADDAIATYVRKHCSQAGKVLIVSEDRDLWQLIKRNVHILTRKGEVGKEECHQLLGVPPRHVRMLKALTGDASDNLPRVPRAKKTALKRLAQECSSIAEMDELLEDNHPEWITAGDMKRLLRFRSQIVCNWKVVGLMSKLRLDIDEHQETASTLIDFALTNGVRLDPRDARTIAEQR